jgi:hypothetical protein
LPSSSVGAGPFRTASPLGRVSDCTTASIGWPTSASTCPDVGPKPARHSMRRACASVIGALSAGGGVVDAGGGLAAIGSGAAAPGRPAALGTVGPAALGTVAAPLTTGAGALAACRCL